MGGGNYAYANQALPCFEGQCGDDYSSLPDTTAAGYWDDLYIYQGTPQGLYYEAYGVSLHRNLTFEWYTSHYGDSSQYYHFTLQFQEAQLGVMVVDYLQISDSGASATVGMQSETGRFVLLINDDHVVAQRVDM